MARMVGAKREMAMEKLLAATLMLPFPESEFETRKR